MLTPIALKFKLKVFYDFIFYISSLGALMAIIFPSRDYVDGVFSVITITFFSFHYLVVVVPLWLFLWKIYSPQISLKGTLGLMGILLLLTITMHFFNIILVNNGLQNANYFWTMVENGKYNNFLLALFADIIHVDFFYLLFCIPILYAYIGIWNLSIYLVKRFSPSYR
jgi:hypothetical protein